MANVSKKERVNQEEVAAAYSTHKGNIRATAKELGIARSTVRRILEPTGLMKKPLAGGTKEGTTMSLSLDSCEVVRIIIEITRL